ncbi:hypothetical protein [Curtobacterium sp. NPDC089689]|uniref:hypothetical protein n=1 Tax=Curtobacterium sp. NPDC089689 TaxID=3363968 RepID=UPI00382E6235
MNDHDGEVQHVVAVYASMAALRGFDREHRCAERASGRRVAMVSADAGRLDPVPRGRHQHQLNDVIGH